MIYSEPRALGHTGNPVQRIKRNARHSMSPKTLHRKIALIWPDSATERLSITKLFRCRLESSMG
jgi:hypothetical protein